MGRPHGDMSLELFKKIIDSSYPYIYFSWLHLFGEPLLNSHVVDMISYASQKKVTCGISTNATALNEELARNLCKSGLDTIIISIDATTDKTYDKIRPGGNFDQVVENTERFLKLPDRENIKHTIIQMIRMKKNQHEVDGFINKWKGSARNVHIKEEDTWAGYFKKKSQSNSIKRFPCRKLWERLTVDWQGNVSICCRDFRMQVNLGNIDTYPLKRLWNGDKMAALRKSHINNKLDDVPLCQHCKEWIFSDPNYTNYESY
jgi:radical SAM protein with 4Fe4S-binding SPASM domain